MILGILSSSITTSHIPLLNSTCLSAPSKAVHSSGSICLWFFMRVSSQGAWVPFPPVLISYLSCVSLLTCIPTHPSPYLHLSGVPLPPKLLHRAFISTPKNFPLKFFSLWIRESSSLRMCFFKDTFPNTHSSQAQKLPFNLSPCSPGQLYGFVCLHQPVNSFWVGLFSALCSPLCWMCWQSWTLNN